MNSNTSSKRNLIAGGEITTWIHLIIPAWAVPNTACIIHQLPICVSGWNQLHLFEIGNTLLIIIFPLVTLAFTSATIIYWFKTCGWTIPTLQASCCWWKDTLEKYCAYQCHLCDNKLLRMPGTTDSSFPHMGNELADTAAMIIYYTTVIRNKLGKSGTVLFKFWNVFTEMIRFCPKVSIYVFQPTRPACLDGRRGNKKK